MIAYTEKTTQELIDLLIEEEDRVTLEHIQELVTRPDAIEPLRVWVVDENRWREARDGEWWALYHAFTILSLTRHTELLGDLIEGYSYAIEEDFDWLMSVGSAAFAQLGEPAVESLIQHIMSQRAKARDDWRASSIRCDLATALARIALEHPAVKFRVTEFLCSRFNDPEETDPSFLGSITGHALMLDKERVLKPMRAAFERGAVDETIAGDFEETLEWYDPEEQRDDWEYHQDLLEFYQPEEIAKRQTRWKEEKENDERRAKQIAEDNLARRMALLTTAAPIMPDGYTQTSEGNFVREEKIGRNEPCSCGSGKKYKKCHGK